MAKAIIAVKNLSKVYQAGEIEIKALDRVSFGVSKGEFVAIMGPSGSGKSTLMHILGALDLPTSGEYWLDGKNIENLTDDQLAEIRNQKIGFIFQAYNLLPRFSAIDNVKLPMDYAGFTESDQQKRAERVLKLVGLADRMAHTPGQLSGGQQQRVAIARALAMEPAILLADEPTGNIASTQAAEIMALFRELNVKGHTIVMITHEQEIAEYAERIIYLLDGKIKEDGNEHRRRNAGLAAKYIPGVVSASRRTIPD